MSDLPPPTPATPAPPVAGAAAPALPTRLESIDALRGFDMLWIMGADAIGGAFLKFGVRPEAAGAVAEGAAQGKSLAARIGHFVGDQLEHVPWEGFRFYDLIFPLFVFIIGVSLVFSLTKLRDTRGFDAALLRVFRRSVVLYLLGIFYYGGISEGVEKIRLLGVLQRLALCYFFASFAFLALRPRNLVVLTAGLLLGYWTLMALVPVPGIGAGDYSEGRNLANWVDSRFLPLFKWDGDHDPEGLLSTLPAIASCLIGVLAGIHLRDGRAAPERKVLQFIGAGVVLILAGYGWGTVFPIIKKIWTSSYVLVAGGWSCILLAAFHWVIDLRGWRGWCQPFVWVGLNPISIYLLCKLVDFDAFTRRFLGGEVEALLDGLIPGLAGLAVAIIGIGWGFVVAWWMHRRKLYLRL